MRTMGVPRTGLPPDQGGIAHSANASGRQTIWASLVEQGEDAWLDQRESALAPSVLNSGKTSKKLLVRLVGRRLDVGDSADPAERLRVGFADHDSVAGEGSVATSRYRNNGRLRSCPGRPVNPLRCPPLRNTSKKLLPPSVEISFAPDEPKVKSLDWPTAAGVLGVQPPWQCLDDDWPRRKLKNPWFRPV